VTPEEIAAEAAKKAADAEEARKALENDPAKMKERLAYLEAESKKAFSERDAERQARKALEDAERARKDADLTEVEKLKAQTDKLNKDLEASQKKAQEWDAFQKTRREQLKTELGDKWDDTFDTLSLEGLEKLKGKLVVADPLKGARGGNSGGGEFYTMDEIKKMSKVEMAANLEKVNKSVAHWGQHT
jgi:chromosome segregation ATPase